MQLKVEYLKEIKNRIIGNKLEKIRLFEEGFITNNIEKYKNMKDLEIFSLYSEISSLLTTIKNDEINKTIKEFKIHEIIFEKIYFILKNFDTENKKYFLKLISAFRIIIGNLMPPVSFLMVKVLIIIIENKIEFDFESSYHKNELFRIFEIISENLSILGIFKSKKFIKIVNQSILDNSFNILYLLPFIERIIDKENILTIDMNNLVNRFYKSDIRVKLRIIECCIYWHLVYESIRIKEMMRNKSLIINEVDDLYDRIMNLKDEDLKGYIYFQSSVSDIEKIIESKNSNFCISINKPNINNSINSKNFFTEEFIEENDGSNFYEKIFFQDIDFSISKKFENQFLNVKNDDLTELTDNFDLLDFSDQIEMTESSVHPKDYKLDKPIIGRKGLEKYFKIQMKEKNTEKTKKKLEMLKKILNMLSSILFIERDKSLFLLSKLSQENENVQMICAILNFPDHLIDLFVDINRNNVSYVSVLYSMYAITSKWEENRRSICKSLVIPTIFAILKNKLSEKKFDETFLVIFCLLKSLTRSVTFLRTELPEYRIIEICLETLESIYLVDLNRKKNSSPRKMYEIIGHDSCLDGIKGRFLDSQEILSVSSTTISKKDNSTFFGNISNSNSSNLSFSSLNSESFENKLTINESSNSLNLQEKNHILEINTNFSENKNTLESQNGKSNKQFLDSNELISIESETISNEILSEKPLESDNLVENILLAIKKETFSILSNLLLEFGNYKHKFMDKNGLKIVVQKSENIEFNLFFLLKNFLYESNWDTKTYFIKNTEPDFFTKYIGEPTEDIYKKIISCFKNEIEFDKYYIKYRKLEDPDMISQTNNYLNDDISYIEITGRSNSSRNNVFENLNTSKEKPLNFQQNIPIQLSVPAMEQLMNVLRNLLCGTKEELKYIFRRFNSLLNSIFCYFKKLTSRVNRSNFPIITQIIYIFVNLSANNLKYKKMMLHDEIIDGIIELTKFKNKKLELSILWLIINLSWKEEEGVKNRIKILKMKGLFNWLKFLEYNDPVFTDKVQTALENLSFYESK
ncbi:hypothetical protein CWI36_1146p0010 [Hamiltosporidium magnivora]|uniref:Uncharacterized protein n=1 Tax=Hamiltosporidium magnivora TaxID=148818 RepID=A0A4Q9L435_9MICR|nr:hypothetical protein CWI36_1146p0010 [Hamiltosporidium magnivora]